MNKINHINVLDGVIQVKLLLLRLSIKNVLKKMTTANFIHIKQ